MAQSHLIALPEQELAALLRASDAQLPAFRAALFSPVDGALNSPGEAALGSIAEYEGGLL